MAGTVGPRRGHGGRHTIISEINVTPLVDIMLVLLIIFMITATHIVKKSILVDLPAAKSGEAIRTTRLTLIIEKNGRLTLNGKATRPEVIRSSIRQEKQSGQRLEAVIAADRAVAHGEVVKIIDLLRDEGVLRLGINVVAPPAGAAVARPIPAE